MKVDKNEGQIVEFPLWKVTRIYENRRTVGPTKGPSPYILSRLDAYHDRIPYRSRYEKTNSDFVVVIQFDGDSLHSKVDTEIESDHFLICMEMLSLLAKQQKKRSSQFWGTVAVTPR
eukprot:Filipodium_phascolosomae@DN7673_c0_g1_i1.p1